MLQVEGSVGRTGECDSYRRESYAPWSCVESRTSITSRYLCIRTVFAPPGGASIERYVPALPLSREVQRFRRLMRTVGAYRMVMGQPRQEDLLRYVGESGADLDWLRLDLSPPR